MGAIREIEDAAWTNLDLHISHISGASALAKMTTALPFHVLPPPNPDPITIHRQGPFPSINKERNVSLFPPFVFKPSRIQS